jgi:hypothetical protein
MRWKVALGAAALLVASSPIPAGGHGLREYVAACLLANPLPCGPPPVEVNFKAKVTPGQLPSREFVPVGATVSGTVGIEGGGHPSALREATVTLNEGIRVDTKGLATCGRRQLGHLAVAAARSACRQATVGRGVAHARLASSGTVLRAPLTLYNGGSSAGVTRLFVHGIGGAAGSALVAVAEIRRRGKGLEATWKLPPILDGDGSLLSFRLEIKRSFAASGQRRSYLSGSCPNGELWASFSKLIFVNEAHIPGVASRTVLAGKLMAPCAPKPA